MPIDRTIASATGDIWIPATDNKETRLSAKKLKYLKKPSISKLKEMLMDRIAIRFTVLLESKWPVV